MNRQSQLDGILATDEVETALAPLPAESDSLTMFERLARDPSVPVEKLEKLIELQERIMRHNAKAAFDSAFSRMQPALPEIDEHGRIEVRGTLRSTYAKLEDIHAAIKPILKEHGFAIRHRTEWPSEKPNIIRIVGILSHEQGHSEESIFEAPMDKSEYRTDIQSMGSTVSYGRRYTTLDLLNLSTRGLDNDGAKPKPAPIAAAPAGFDNWWHDLQNVADNGFQRFAEMWKSSPTVHRNHAMATKKDELSALKAKAQAVKVAP
jgi:hypothetical protein